MRALPALAVVSVAAACGGPAAIAPAPAGSHPIDEPAPRSTPAPVIAWTSGAFELHGLPAIAAAGEVIELGSPQPDGKQLAVELRDADDHLLRKTIVTADKLDAANHDLATDHGVHDLRPMHPLEVEAAHGGEDQHWATGDNLDVEWREHHLRVFRHNVTQPLADHEASSWLAPASASASCVGANPAFLRAVDHAVGLSPGGGNTVLVVIGYRGTDACPAPPDAAHVISWVGAAR